MILAHVVHRIATDPGFTSQLLHNTQQALSDADLTLSPEVADRLVNVLRTMPDWQELCSPALPRPLFIGWFGSPHEQQ